MFSIDLDGILYTVELVGVMNLIFSLFRPFSIEGKEPSHWLLSKKKKKKKEEEKNL